MSSSRSPGQRAGLTRAAVLAGARAVLSERGLDGLTMRALAEHLGVAPNALYSHVESKTALVDDVLDDVLGEVPAPPGPAAARPGVALHAIMSSTYRVLLAHADLVPAYLARQGARGPNATALGEMMFTCLGDAGVHGDEASRAVRVLIVYTIGFAAFVTGVREADRRSAGPSARELAGNFDAGLHWLLAGIGVPARPATP